VNPIVLLIDDNYVPVIHYVRHFQQVGFEIKHFFDPDTALEWAKKERKHIAAILLDIMMPPGEKYQDEDTNEGLKTGVLLYQDLRRLCPRVPVIVLTNVEDQETLRLFDEGPLLKVVQKLDYPPVELAALVRERLQDATRQSPGPQEDAHGE
jgi:CheY-like chemotaxis protein